MDACCGVFRLCVSLSPERSEVRPLASSKDGITLALTFIGASQSQSLCVDNGDWFFIINAPAYPPKGVLKKQ